MIVVENQNDKNSLKKGDSTWRFSLENQMLKTKKWIFGYYFIKSHISNYLHSIPTMVKNSDLWATDNVYLKQTNQRKLS